MQIIIRNVQYHPDSAGSVAIYCEHDFGARFFTTTQAALEARTNGGAGGGVWSDAEVLTEAQALIDAEYPGQGHTAALPEAV